MPPSMPSCTGQVLLPSHCRPLLLQSSSPFVAQPAGLVDPAPTPPPRLNPPLHHPRTTHLYCTCPGAGEQSRDFCVVLATNRPSDLDPAVIDRTDDAIEFALPGPQERHRILQVGGWVGRSVSWAGPLDYCLELINRAAWSSPQLDPHLPLEDWSASSRRCTTAVPQVYFDKYILKAGTIEGGAGAAAAQGLWARLGAMLRGRKAGGPDTITVRGVSDADLMWAAERTEGFSGGWAGWGGQECSLFPASRGRPVPPCCPSLPPQCPPLPPPPSPLPRAPAGRELAKFMASVQAQAYGSHAAELTPDMFRAMTDAKVSEHAKRRSFIEAGGGDAPY